LFYPNKTIQPAGVVLGMLGTAGHIFRGLKPGTLTSFWLPDWPRNYLAVTAACVAVDAKKFDKVDGFDEHFITAGSDVRLGLALYESGYQNVYWPFAQLTHYENVSVGAYNKRNDNQHDYDESMKYYKRYIDQGDPYYNPNLDIMSEIPILRRKDV
jgi:GT2 family glycosyltransferase